jgi:hypothetical protein
LQIGATAGQNTKLDRKIVARCQQLNFDAVKIAAIARNLPAIKFIAYKAASVYENIVTARKRKRVWRIRDYQCNYLRTVPSRVEQTINQIRQTVHSARKSRPAQKPFDESEFVKNNADFLEITAEIKHRCDGNRDDFSICNWRATVFAVTARLKKIVGKTVYCNSAIAHLMSSASLFVW